MRLRLVVVPVLVCGAVSLTALPASAAPPTVEPSPPTASFLVEAGPSGCSFDVMITLVVSGKTRTYYDRDGNVVRDTSTGRVLQTATRTLADGTTRSVTSNVSGPVFATYHADGTTEYRYAGLTGGPSSRGLVTSAGLGVVVVDATGTVVVDTFPHHVVDLCAQLA